MRLSAVQKDILFILYAVEQKGNTHPVPGMNILEMVNKSRSSNVADTNFRTSCHTLNEHQMIVKFRSQSSLKLAWTLSAGGREKAKELYDRRLKEMAGNN